MPATRSLKMDDLWRVRVPQDPEISPDGARVLYAVKQADQETDGYGSSIWVVASDGSGEPVQLTQGPADSGARWSPDGKTIAFLSKRAGSDRPQIYLLPVGGGEPRRITDLPLGAGVPFWSPDGKRLAFSSAVDLAGPAEGEPEAAARPNAPLVIDRLGYKADGIGLIRTLRQHLHVIGVEGIQTPVQLTWGDWWMSPPAWSPDGTTLVVAGSRADDRDLEPGSRLWAVPAGGGGTPRPLTPEQGLAGSAVFSPDGVTIAYIGQTDTEVGNAHLLVMPAGGGEPRSLSASLDRNLMPGSTGYPGGPLRITSDGRALFCARDRGCTHVYAVALDGDAPPRRLFGDAGNSVSGLSVTAEGMTIATVVAHGGNSGEVTVLPEGTAEPVVLTDLFAESLPDIDLMLPQDRVFTAPDGTEIHGWIVRDPDAPRGPLLLDVHGGPHNAWTPVFTNSHHYHQTLAAEGWTVLYVNPRGSDGYGEAFMRAVIEGWGTSDTDDFLCAIDALVEEGLVDNSQLAVTGYSYGGYMTCWLTATTDRFAAGITGAACSSLESETGTADVGLWLSRREIGADPWHDPELYRKHSPQAFVANVTCPTLILHGETDDRCPVEQGEEWFTALRAREVPVEFVRYPGGSHLFRVDGRPSHRIDFNQRVVDWVREWVAPGPAVSRPKPTACLDGYATRLDSLAQALNVPGVSLALLHDGVIETAYAGKLHCERPEKVTAESRFQIGSITKVFTTALVMQLVEEGRVELDTPVVAYLPDFKLADPAATAAITVRHLLAHTSGIPGDWFPELGESATAAQYVATLADFGLAHPVGEHFDYSNAAFVLAGRLVEVLTARPWADVLAERIVGPLSLEMAATGDPAGGLIVGLAMGHLPADPASPLGASVPASRYATHPESASCGSTPVATARALATFAQMFINDGQAPDGTEVLTAAAVKQMAERQADVPPAGHDGWRTRGLGWGLGEWEGQQILQHRGGTLGQTSGLTVMPSKGVAVAILTNGPGGFALCKAVEADLFSEVTGIAPPGPPEPPTDPIRLDLSRYAGRFASIGAEIEVTVHDDKLLVAVTPLMGLDPAQAPPAPPPVQLTPVDELTFAAPDGSVLSFVAGDDGELEYLFTGRLHRRQQ